jgi:hypothetical protein
MFIGVSRRLFMTRRHTRATRRRKRIGNGILALRHPRQLKYMYDYDSAGDPVCGPDGRRIVKGKLEKGVDVLCALALIRETRRPDVDLVILASHDTYLEPALAEAVGLGTAKIETFCWWDPAQRNRCRQLRLPGRSLWNTRLGERNSKIAGTRPSIHDVSLDVSRCICRSGEAAKFLMLSVVDGDPYARVVTAYASRVG